MLKSSQYFQEPLKRMLRMDRMGLLVTGGQDHRPSVSTGRQAQSCFDLVLAIKIRIFDYHYDRLQKPELQQSPPLLSLILIITPQHCPLFTFWKERVWTFSQGWSCTHHLVFLTPSITGMDHYTQLKVCECGSQRSPYRVVLQEPSALFETGSVIRTWGSLIILVQEASKPQVSAFHCLLSSRITDGCCQALL